MTSPTPPAGWSENSPPATADAGWYPVDANHQRYWDGNAWSDHTAPLAGSQPAAATPGPTGAVSSDDRNIAMLMHLLGLFVSVLGPLIIWLMKKDQSPFIDHHGKQALNFHITYLMAMVVSFVLVFVLIGFVLIPVVFVAYFVFGLIAAVKANQGEYYRIPLVLPILN